MNNIYIWNIVSFLAGCGFAWLITHIYHKIASKKIRDIEMLNLMASLGNKGKWTNQFKSVVNRYLDKISEKLNGEQKTAIDQMIKIFAINVYDYVVTVHEAITITEKVSVKLGGSAETSQEVNE